MFGILSVMFKKIFIVFKMMVEFGVFSFDLSVFMMLKVLFLFWILYVFINFKINVWFYLLNDLILLIKVYTMGFVVNDSISLIFFNMIK